MRRAVLIINRQASPLKDIYKNMIKFLQSIFILAGLSKSSNTKIELIQNTWEIERIISKISCYQEKCFFTKICLCPNYLRTNRMFYSATEFI
jgi:hypothetical protein